MLASEVPVFEVHITNIHTREALRHHSFVSAGARGVICGFGIEGYGLAIDGAAELLARHAGEEIQRAVTRRNEDLMAEAKKTIDQELIRELATLLTDTGLTEIEVEQSGLRVRVARQPGVTHVAAPMPVAIPAAIGASACRRAPPPPTSPSIRARCSRRWSARPIGRASPAACRSSTSARR